jgi:LuxR family transcriptional regulator, maltose regulon positive regulatory protein
VPPSFPLLGGANHLAGQLARRASDCHSLAWLTLDETDDEPRRFWTYVVTALRTAPPNLGDSALAAMQVRGIDPLDVAFPALLNDLSASSAKRTLVLDDYHLLTDVRIHQAPEYLVSYLPPSLRLAIAARFDPPLPLARMRARGELTELRAADLPFSSTEAAGLVAAVGQVEVRGTPWMRWWIARLGGGAQAGRPNHSRVPWTRQSGSRRSMATTDTASRRVR